MEIDPKAITEFLQLGGQYLLPIASLLRALYSGIRGKLPEGFSQIAVASLFAGIIAAVNNQNLDLRSIGIEILSNGFFTAGLLSFIIVYLLRMENRGEVVDAIVGGVAGLVFWLAWTQILNEPWPWWTAPLAIAGGAAAFVALRFSLRQIAKLVKAATYFLVIGIFLVIGGGAILILQTLSTTLSQTP